MTTRLCDPPVFAPLNMTGLCDPPVFTPLNIEFGSGKLSVRIVRD